ncbi:hypothetical protein AWB98_29190, partial [Mycolicibacterium conceptionense]
SSHVVAWGSSHVVAWGSSHVVAWGSSHVVARGSSHVEARGSSHVVAWGSSHVVAWDSSHVVARDSSHVEARGSSHVVAWGSSHVVARDSSHVVARGSSHVEATKYVGIHLHSQRVTLDGNGQVIDLTTINFDDPATWCEFHGVTVTDGIAYLYKAVNREWTTGRGVDYSPGTLPEAPDWDATWRDCGKGLNFCDHPLRSLDYLGGPVDEARFLKVGVRLDEMVTLGDKIKARRVVVACVEVDRYGREIEAVTA